MKRFVNSEFTLMKWVSIVQGEMDRRGWIKADLVRESGISSRAATCFFQDGRINSENTFRILACLGLIDDSKDDRENECPVQCDEHLAPLCEKVKRVLESNTGFSAALEANIHAFDESLTLKEDVRKLKKQLENFTKTIGRDGGIAIKPVKNTAGKRKAG